MLQAENPPLLLAARCHSQLTSARRTYLQSDSKGVSGGENRRAAAVTESSGRSGTSCELCSAICALSGAWLPQPACQPVQIRQASEAIAAQLDVSISKSKGFKASGVKKLAVDVPVADQTAPAVRIPHNWLQRTIWALHFAATNG